MTEHVIHCLFFILMSPCRIHNILRTEPHCLHFRGFTDVLLIITTIISDPKFVATKWYTIGYIPIKWVWLTRGPVYKTQCTVVWRPNVRPFHGKVISSDPEYTTLPPMNRTHIWQRKSDYDKTNPQISSSQNSQHFQ